MAALVKERSSLALEKKALEFEIDDLQKMALAAKSRAKNSLDLEKRDLEAGASKLTADLCYVINPN
jgi:hypothetical protein